MFLIIILKVCKLSESSAQSRRPSPHCSVDTADCHLFHPAGRTKYLSLRVVKRGLSILNEFDDPEFDTPSWRVRTVQPYIFEYVLRTKPTICNWVKAVSLMCGGVTRWSAGPAWAAGYLIFNGIIVRFMVHVDYINTAVQPIDLFT